MYQWSQVQFYVEKFAFFFCVFLNLAEPDTFPSDCFTNIQIYFFLLNSAEAFLVFTELYVVGNFNIELLYKTGIGLAKIIKYITDIYHW